MGSKVLIFAVVAIGVLLASGGVALAATTVSGNPDSGPVQTDGRVSAVVATGGKVYLGGYFTHVNGLPRNHLAAVDASTGQLTSWDPNANAAVQALAVSADGTRIYAGGPFTSVGGISRPRLAAINASSGAVDATFTPRADDSVKAIAVRGNKVYIGGRFPKVNGQPRTRLALVDGTTGALDPSWAPTANDVVRTMAVSADGSRVYAGGDFTSVNGASRPYLSALDPTTGAISGGWTNPTTPNGTVFDLQESGGRLFSAEGGPGGALTAYDPATGRSIFRKTADGDVQALAVMGGEVYAGGHFVTFSSYARQFLTAVDAQTGATDPNWAPSAYGANCSSVWSPDPCSDFVWAMEADPAPGRLYAGGDFRKVSGAPHAGFAQFTFPPAGSDTTSPETTIDSGPSGAVNTGSASFVFSSSEAGSTFECSLDGALYKPCTSPQSYTGLAEGTHTFSVRATDAAGNTDPTPASRTWTVQAGGTTVEAETMTRSGSSAVLHSASAASGGQDVAFYSNGSASKGFDGAATQVVLRARGTNCDGFPQLKVYVDGTLKDTKDLTSSTYADYTLALAGLSGGTHTLRVSYENDHSTGTCDRNAYLDYYALA